MSTCALMAIAKLTIVEATRNRLVWLSLLGVAAVLGVAELLGAMALTDSVGIKQAMIGTMLRLGAALLLSMFVVSSMLRDIHDKGFEMLLSLPLKRWQLLLGKLTGYATLAIGLAVLCTLAALIHAELNAALVWGMTLAGELLIIMCASVLCLFTFSQTTSAMAAVMAFYILSRAIAAIQLMGEGPMMFASGLGQDLLIGSVDALAYVLPDLDRFADSAWLVYGAPDVAVVGWIALQTMVYVALLTLASAFDLYRKNW
jgi:ABC-type Na+ efflux pump permease subunit